MTTPTSFTFDPPGPGGWMRLADHFPNALTPEYQRLYSETCPAGMGSYMAVWRPRARRSTSATSTATSTSPPVPLAGPREMKRTPRRRRVADGTAPSRVPRSHEGGAPCARRASLACGRGTLVRVRARPVAGAPTKVESVDPAGLSDDELVMRLADCRQLAVDGYRRHFELHGDDLLPVGLLIARCAGGLMMPAACTSHRRGGQRAGGNDDTARLAARHGLRPRRARVGRAPDPTEPQPAPTVVARPRRARARRALGRAHGSCRRCACSGPSARRQRCAHGSVAARAPPAGDARGGTPHRARRPRAAVELTVDELVARLDGGTAPSLEEASARRATSRVVPRWKRRSDSAPSCGPPLSALPRRSR